MFAAIKFGELILFFLHIFQASPHFLCPETNFYFIVIIRCHHYHPFSCINSHCQPLLSSSPISINYHSSTYISSYVYPYIKAALLVDCLLSVRESKPQRLTNRADLGRRCWSPGLILCIRTSRLFTLSSGILNFKTHLRSVSYTHLTLPTRRTV